MARPDFALHRRRLRRLRVAEALRLDVDVDDQQRSRDLLIEALMRAVPEAFTEGELKFATADDALLDLVVSVALAVFPESETDALSVTLVCAQILAQDGQFARLQQLAGRFTSIGRRLEVERPFLAAYLEALGLVLNEKQRTAVARLRGILGLKSGRREPAVERNQDSLADLLTATAFLKWLEADGAGEAASLEALDFLAAARDVALLEGNGLLLANLEFVGTLARASFDADSIRVLSEYAPGFAEPPLRGYLRDRAPRTLFPPQMAAIASGAMTPGNELIALPTSSGKTLLAELKIAAVLTASPGMRALYVAPYRLLSRQVERSLRRGLSHLALTVSDLGSGFDAELEEQALPDVAILTPERLDGLMRLADSKRPGHEGAKALLASLSLLVFDEMQLVGRQGRGSRFEMLLTRLRSRYPELNFLGLSAATHGAEELANWIGAPEPVSGAKRPTGTLELLWQTDGSLMQRSGRTASKVADLPRSKQASDDAAKLGLRFSEAYHPILFVEPTRPLAEGSAKRLHKFGIAEGRQWRDGLSNSDRRILDEVVEEVHALLGKGHPMGDMLAVGVAYHHAGIPTHLLRQIEGLAERRLLRFFVATTTVAEGADLPFRVAILPHLNFQGSTGRLERDLYLNIIGRAGRANVAVEGLVVILDSDARSLANIVRTSLWSGTGRDRVRSVLPNVTPEPASVADYAEFRELQGQLLGWLAEGGDELSNEQGRPVTTLAEQVHEMTRRTFVARSGDEADIAGVRVALHQALNELAEAGLVRASSPYKLTPSGEMTRMTGLSFVSALRLERACTGPRGAWLADLHGVHELDAAMAEVLARTVLETEEVLKESIWLRRASTSPEVRLSIIQELASGTRDWPSDEDEFETDVLLLSGWLLGTEYRDLGEIPRNYKAGLFGGTDTDSRASDAAEQIGRISYAAGWAFGAIRQLAPIEFPLPVWLRSAFEVGTPTETGCELVRVFGLTRSGASILSNMLSADWTSGLEELRDIDEASLRELGLTTLDLNRLLEVVRA